MLFFVTIQIKIEQLMSMPAPWLRIHARTSPFRRGVCSVAGSALYSLLFHIHRGIWYITEPYRYHSTPPTRLDLVHFHAHRWYAQLLLVALTGQDKLHPYVLQCWFCGVGNISDLIFLYMRVLKDFR